MPEQTQFQKFVSTYWNNKNLVKYVQLHQQNDRNNMIMKVAFNSSNKLEKEETIEK